MSSLSFTGGKFDTLPNTPFKLGTLRFHNGTIAGNAADTVEFDTQIKFDNIPEKNFTVKTSLSLVNTPNTADTIPGLPAEERRRRLSAPSNEDFFEM